MRDEPATKGIMKKDHNITLLRSSHKVKCGPTGQAYECDDHVKAPQETTAKPEG